MTCAPVSPAALSDRLAVMIRAARAGGAAALRFHRAGATTSAKIRYKVHNSPVTEADLAADAAIRAVIAAAMPDVAVLSEEDETAQMLGNGLTLVMDPIDGTRAFITGHSEWCVSLALMAEGRAVAGVIHAPSRDELFAAGHGLGATLNGTALPRRTAGAGPIRVTGPNRLIDTLTDHWPPIVDGATLRALAYRLVSVAAGAHDVAVATVGANHWDIAAADVILAETGCALRTLTGGRPVYNSGDPVHPALLAAEVGLATRLLAALEQPSA